MGDRSQIEWTAETWNPVTCCTKVSAGCKHCYAERLARRLQLMGNDRYLNGFRLTLHNDVVDLPRSWRSGRMIFVNSMSDLFHKQVPLDFIQRVFTTMRECSQHTFQILTKRSERLQKLASHIDWPPNVWMGVSVEDARVLSRIDHLRNVPAAVCFLSCELLIGSVSVIDFLVEMADLKFGFEIDLVIIFSAQPVTRLSAVLTHHDDRRLNSGET